MDNHLCHVIVDLIALVKNVGSLEEYRRDDQTRKKLRINLCDLETQTKLYVACSLVRSVDGLKIYIPSSNGSLKRSTKNVVYDEVFRKVYNKE